MSIASLSDDEESLFWSHSRSGVGETLYILLFV